MALAAETLFNIYVNGSLVWERKSFREAMRRLPGRVKVEPAKFDEQKTHFHFTVNRGIYEGHYTLVRIKGEGIQAEPYQEVLL